MTTTTPRSTMDRRAFLRRTIGAGAGAAVASTFGPVLTGTATRAFAAAGGRPSARRLVLLNLSGGNDALGTVVPFADPAYLGARGALAVTADAVHPIGAGLGLHKELGGVKALWDRGMVAVVNGVGYPEPQLSHFRSSDVWESGLPGSHTPSGWVGRWLERTPAGAIGALHLGTSLPLALTGERRSGLAIPPGVPSLPASGRLEAAVAGMWQPSQGRSPLEGAAASSGSDLLAGRAAMSDAYRRVRGGERNPLAALDAVSRFVRAGLPTRVYSVSLGGFDTHAGEQAAHDRLLRRVGEGITSFFSTLDHAGVDDVVLVAYSEFGRRLAPNASGGTDHGTAGTVIVAGRPVAGGLYGEPPSLTKLDGNGNLRHTTDFRSIYAAVLGSVLQIDPGAVLGPGAPRALPLLG